jgi:hypothetical protein
MTQLAKKLNTAEILEFQTHSIHTAVSGQQRTAWQAEPAKRGVDPASLIELAEAELHARI